MALWRSSVRSRSAPPNSKFGGNQRFFLNIKPGKVFHLLSGNQKTYYRSIPLNGSNISSRQSNRLYLRSINSGVMGAGLTEGLGEGVNPFRRESPSFDAAVFKGGSPCMARLNIPAHSS